MPASFEVSRWALSPTRDRLELSYVLDHFDLGRHTLVERIGLPVVVPADVAASETFALAATLLAAAAGVSYFKAAAPTEVAFGPDLTLDPAGQVVIAALYDEGLREFSHANGLPLPRPIALQVGEAPTPIAPRRSGDRVLVPIGAGRDSSLLAAVLATVPGPRPVLLAIGENPYAARVAAATGLELIVATRAIDPALMQLNANGALNGHVPVTAINSLVSVIVALATGCRSVVMANERSASQPTRVVDGVEINHQYSKSFAFEQMLATAVRPTGVAYFSALRPWGELPIAAAFAALPDAVHHAFMSCNRAFVRDPARRSGGWCGDCPKCRSVFLSLAPFLAPDRLRSIFGRDLLADETQVEGFLALVDPEAKPFECVGEIDEARLAAVLLAADERWRDHAVVQALAAAGAPPTSATDAFARHGDHAVPPDLLDVLAAAIDPPAEAARARAARTSPAP